MAVTPASGSISKSKELLATTFANNAAFQTWCNAADAAEAALHIFTDELPPPRIGDTYSIDKLREYRPFVIIETASVHKTPVASGAYTEYVTSGLFDVWFEADVDDDLSRDASEAVRIFENALGGIIDGFQGMAGVGGYLDIQDHSLDTIGRMAPDFRDEYGDAMFCSGQIEWGPPQG